MLATRPHKNVSTNGRKLVPAEPLLTVENPNHDPFGDEADSMVLGLIHVLRQLGEVIAGVSPEQYTAKPGRIANSSIGCHVRHCLDHVNALLEGIEASVLDYDERQRGTNIEHDRHAAFELIVRMEDRLRGIDSACMSRSLSVKVMPKLHGAALSTSSSVGREMAFTQSHTIHHGAIIAMTCKILGAEVPEGFGYAPSTIAHQERTAFAPSRSSR